MGANTKVVNTPNQAFPNIATIHETITVDTTAATLLSKISGTALHANTTHVMIQIQDAAIWVTFDQNTTHASGATDSAAGTTGFSFPADTTVYWPRALFEAAHADSLGTATLQIQQMSYKGS